MKSHPLSMERSDLEVMVRTLTMEREAKLAQAKVLRKKGWTQQAIAQKVGLAQQVISYHFTKNDLSRKVGKGRQASNNSRTQDSYKPYFESEFNSIFNADFLTTQCVEEGSVDLVITSPPYNVTLGYSSYDDDLSYDDYMEFTRAWLTKCLKLVKDDGRFCLNIPLGACPIFPGKMASDGGANKGVTG